MLTSSAAVSHIRMDQHVSCFWFHLLPVSLRNFFFSTRQTGQVQHQLQDKSLDDCYLQLSPYTDTREKTATELTVIMNGTSLHHESNQNNLDVCN